MVFTRNLALKSRQWRAHAEMDAVREGNVLVWRPPNVESIRLRELGGIAVRGRQRQKHHLLGRDHFVIDLNFGLGGPEQYLEGTFKAADFFDRAVNQ